MTTCNMTLDQLADIYPYWTFIVRDSKGKTLNSITEDMTVSSYREHPLRDILFVSITE